MTHDLAHLLARPRRLAALIADHLRRRDLWVANRASAPRDEHSQYDRDRRWAKELSGESTVLPAFVAVSQLEGARQHLRAIASLLVVDDVDQAVLGSSRACVESSARAMHVVDVKVGAPDRTARALNEVWELINGPGRAASEARDDFRNLAFSLGIDHRETRKTSQFGSEPRASMRQSLELGLADLGYPSDYFDKLMPFWNGAAHAGVDAGLLTFAIRGGDASLGDNARSSAALAALAAFGRADNQVATYQGYSKSVEPPPDDALRR